MAINANRHALAGAIAICHVFLASREARYVTEQIVGPIDGKVQFSDQVP